MPARTAKSCEAPQTGLFCSLFPGTSPGLAATTTQALRELRARTASVGEVSLSQFSECSPQATIPSHRSAGHCRPAPSSTAQAARLETQVGSA